jgi:putative radical SAM enzyme (TIGR03279 family)
LLAINGHRVRDIIDYRFYGADERLELEIERDGKRLAFAADREYGEEFGLRFAEDVFDGIRRCVNRCEFCFVDQMPPGLRAPLYVKDDDYRYSFLHGNFITLSNWREEDWTRIAEQHLSPLYISVHSTDGAVRGELLCNPQAPEILPQLRRLAALGIAVHAQVVVIPGKNDGGRLEHTIRDLSSLHPAVQSIGVVPVGLTKYHSRNVRLLSTEEERLVLQTVQAWQEDNMRKRGSRVVYASDELYLRAGYAVPLSEEYEGFPQLENGIGLVRQLIDGWRELSEGGFELIAPRRGTAVCGTLVAPVLSGLLRELGAESGLDVELRPVTNEFFGPMVSVSGLLTAADVLAALENQDLPEVVFLPRSMFGAQGRLTLDGATVDEITVRLGVPVIPVTELDEVVSHFESGSIPDQAAEQIA